MAAVNAVDGAVLTPAIRKAAKDAAIAAVGNEIALPAGVTAQGWRKVNGINYPLSFTHAQVSTDQQCLKHVFVIWFYGVKGGYTMVWRLRIITPR